MLTRALCLSTSLAALLTIGVGAPMALEGASTPCGAMLARAFTTQSHNPVVGALGNLMARSGLMPASYVGAASSIKCTVRYWVSIGHPSVLRGLTPDETTMTQAPSPRPRHQFDGERADLDTLVNTAR